MKKMGRHYYLSHINRLLGSAAYDAKISSGGNRNDVSIHDEQIFCGLLNRIEGWNLRKADATGHINFPAVDLVDEKARIAVQVTVRNESKKVDQMLEDFYKHKLNQTFDHLILLVITLEKPTSSMKSRLDSCFSGTEDIWNIPRLMRKIESIEDVDRLEEIAEYLEKELGTINPLDQKNPELDSEDEKLQKPENPETQKKEKQKTRKHLWIKLMVPLIALCLLFCFLMRHDQLDVMPADLAGYTLIINEELVQLPTTFKKMEQIGWEFEDNTQKGELLAPGDYGPSGYFRTGYQTTLTNGFGTMDVWYGNPTNHSLRVEDCIIYKISVTSWSTDNNTSGKPVNTFRVSDSFILRQSKWDDRSRPDGYTKVKRSTLTNYYYTLDDDHWYNFMFDADTGILTDIVICCRDEDAMEALAGELYDSQPPQYDAEELMKWIGVDMGFLVGEIRIPIGRTVETYRKMGYRSDEAPEFLASGDLDDFYFSCGEDTRVIGKVYNPFTRALSSDWCYMGSMNSNEIRSREETHTFYCSAGETEITITQSMTEKELISLLDAMKLDWFASSTDSITFFPNWYNKKVVVECFFSGSDRNVSHIRADICEALRDYFFATNYQTP